MDFKPINRKREQKTSLFFHEISSLIQQLAMDEPAIAKVYVTQVRLSRDYNICFVYFSTFAEKKDFDEALKILKLYKPSLRKAMAQKISAKYAADLVFLYDEVKEKERKMQELLDKVAKEFPEVK